MTRGQLLAAGISAAAIHRRVRAGVLLTEHRGVYRLGHRAPSPEATYLAAVLACGNGSLLCGQAAAHLHGLLRGSAPPAQVATPTERRIEGVCSRRSRIIEPGDHAVVRGIPVMSVAWTVVDLAADLRLDELARACHEAGVLHRTAPADVEAVLARRPSSPGAANLRRVMRGDTLVTLSGLERRFLALLRKHGLPLPETNRPVNGRRVDCRWPEQHLTVELDSYTYHSSRHAWEQDRAREREARARGDELRRYTTADVDHPRLMLRELQSLLLGGGNPV